MNGCHFRGTLTRVPSPCLGCYIGLTLSRPSFCSRCHKPGPCVSWDVVLGHEASRAKTRWLVTLVGNRGAEGREGRGASGVMRVSLH